MALAAGAPVQGVRPDMSAFERATLAKVTRRLVPFLFLACVVNWLDRGNVSVWHAQTRSRMRSRRTRSRGVAQDTSDGTRGRRWLLGCVVAGWLPVCMGCAGPGRRSAPETPTPPRPQASGDAPAPTRAPATPPVALPDAPPAASGSARDYLLATENEYQGWRYYQVHCARCHGDDARGSLLAPNLRRSISSEGHITADTFLVVVRTGRTRDGMPSFRELLEDSQIAQIYQYVKARSEGRLGPGRPRRVPTHLAPTSGRG